MGRDPLGVARLLEGGRKDRILRSLKRFFTLKDEVLIFLTEQNTNLADYFHDNLWLLKLCYLADIFDKINGMNLLMQGVCVNIFILKNNHLFICKVLEFEFNR